MSDQKKEMRIQMKSLLAGLDKRWIKAASKRICFHLESIVGAEDTFEHILAPTAHFVGEVELSAFISRFIDTHSIYLPRSESTGELKFISIGTQWESELKPGSYGIPEPSSTLGAPYNLDNAKRTVCIVPGLAFDAHGRRLGRGKSYYDRYLSHVKMQTVTRIGICWSLQMFDSVPVDQWDVPMHYVVSEEGILEI